MSSSNKLKKWLREQDLFWPDLEHILRVDFKVRNPPKQEANEIKKYSVYR